MWTHEARIETTATPPQVWAIFADVAQWKQWNTGIESIAMHGSFATGTTFTMQAPGQDALESTLVAVQPNQGFTDETIVDATCVRVSHQLIALPSGGTTIIYRTEITGPDAAAIGQMVTMDFPDVLAALKQRAERQG